MTQYRGSQVPLRLSTALVLISLLLAGCGASAAPPTATPSPAPTGTPTPLATPQASRLQPLLDVSGKGGNGHVSNGYAFTVPQGYFRLAWQFHCPSTYGYGPTIFVIFANVKSAPLIDPGEQEHTGSGVVGQSAPPGSRIVLSVIAYKKCRYHLRAVG